jgi:hypothetical protein
MQVACYARRGFGVKGRCDAPRRVDLPDREAPMRKRLRMVVATVFAAVALGATAGAGIAAEHHPPKFGPHDNPYAGGSNQPNCPGGH